MKKRRLVLVLMLVLCTFAQSESQTALGEDSRDQSINHISAQQANDITQVEADVSDWWAKECVDCPKQVTNRSLWLDADGLPHIAYGCEQLHTASFDGVDWQLASDDWLAHVGTCLDPVIDQWGYPHLVYFDELQSALMYAYKNTSGWHLQTVDSAGAVVVGASLALDGQGQPHISYSRSLADYPDVDFDLIYAYRVDGEWNTVTVDQPEVIPEVDAIYAHTGKTSLVMDGNGNAHIGYVVDYNWDTGFPADLKYAFQDDGGWTIELVNRFDGLSDFNDAFSMTLDGNGYPHFAYAEPVYMFYSVYSRLEYAFRGTEGWEHQIIDDLNYGRINSISMVMDDNGYAHLSYPWVNSLKYTYQDHDGWHVTTLVDASTQNPTIVLGKDGYPHISYNEHSQDTIQEVIHLKYRYQDEGGWYEQTVDSGGGDVGEYVSLVLDGMYQPHLSYYDVLLKYAYKDSNSWHTENVDHEGDVGASLALDEQGKAHIIYKKHDYCSGRGGPYICESYLKYAFQNGVGWQTETLDRCSEYGGISLTLDREGYPHISYLGESGLKYAHLDASGWHKQTVVIYAEDHSLALDQDGNPHISFSNSDNYNNHLLYYAYLDDYNWIIENVASWKNGGYVNQLAIDGNGQPHISYLSYKDPISYLKYAYLGDNGWNIETIVSWQYGGGVDSLVLDSDGYAHISYRVGPSYIGSPLYTFVPDYTQKYAYQDANGWNFQTIDRGKALRDDQIYKPYASLALDQDGLPHISYKKGFNLMYIFDTGLIWPRAYWGYGLPGSTITYTLKVVNTTQITDTLNVAASESEWPIVIPSMVGPLAPAESAAMDVQVTISTTVTLGSTDTVTITVASQGDSSRTGSATLTTFTGQVAFMPLIEK